MDRAIEWFAKNGVAANLLMVIIIVGGALTAWNLRREVFPELSTDIITVSVVYRGAAPEEVEEGVVSRIEERIQDLQGIKRISSTASENVGTIMVEVLEGYDSRELLNDVKARVDAIDTLPDETERPVVTELILRRQVITVAVSGDADERTLKKLGERVRDDLAAIPEITQVELQAVRPYEISIGLSEESLRRHGLTFDFVANAIRRASLDLPGGAVRSRSGEILLRTEGQAYRGDEFAELVLMTRPDGTRLLLGDVATIDDGFAETDQRARFDGKPAALVYVFRVGDQDATVIADAVKAYVERSRSRMPDGIELTTWQDDTRILKSRLDLLIRNGRTGLILVFIVLALFLKLRLAGWVALGIPISFLGALWLMPLFDISINLMSLFAFIVVLGIVVDDAIVVGENIFSHFQRGKPALQAAIDGAREVATPVTFSILTTIAAFSPLIFVPGTMGKIMEIIPIIVISTLVFSLVESLFVLPTHLSHLKHREKERESGGLRGAWARFSDGFAERLNRLIERWYAPSLARCLEWRYVTAAVSIALLIITAGFIGGGWIKFTFLPPVEADNVVAIVSMPLGTPSEVTEDAVRRIERAALDLRQELESEGAPVFRHILASVGEQPFRTAQSQGAGSTGTIYSGSHLGEVNIELAPSEERDLTSQDVARRWREKVGVIADASELSFTASLFSAGEPVNVQLTGNDLEQLQTVAVRLKERLGEYPGVFDISDSFRLGKEEIEVDVTAEGEAAGLTRADLARQVRQAFYGEEAQRVQRGRDDVRVMVRYPADDRATVESLEQMRIRTPDGGEIPFTTAGSAEFSRGYASIRRVDRRRAVNVTADVDPSIANANEILADLQQNVLPALLADYPSVRYSLEGEQKEQRDTIGGLQKSFAIALLVIFALLAIPFESYYQPLIVMIAIPFGVIGAVAGHVVMGLDLTVLSFFGIVALTGVVVNDSLVMVDFINRRYREGVPIRQSLVDSGKQRFRPILLTSLTTFVGLLPLLLERSVQAQFLIPMAVSLAFGVLFATVITLYIVPVLYRILEDARRAVLRFRGIEEIEPTATRA